MKTCRESANAVRSDIPGQVSRRKARQRARMASIAHKFAVMSGKGGVGKSAVTVNLAAALAMQGQKVGILGADINGPCVARMLGVRDRMLMFGAGGIVPMVGPLGIKVVSVDVPLSRGAMPATRKASARRTRHTWLGTVEASALNVFLTDTLWGELDFLLIDLPSGPGRYPALHDLLPDCDGALVVTNSSGAAARKVKRSMVHAQAERAPLFGMIENMSGYWCKRYGVVRPNFSDEPDAARQEPDVPVLGRVPFDPRMARCCDRGVLFMADHPDTPAGRAFTNIVAQITKRCVQAGAH